jgi:hypothetical protein
MQKKIVIAAGVLILLIVLVALPLVGRWLYYYDGRYQPSPIPRPDLAQVAAPTPEMPAFTDQPALPSDADQGLGAIVVDRAHDNRFATAELNVLQARLAARDQRLELVEAAEDLAGRLRYAQALVIISPGESFTATEVQTIQAFVDKGGRLLLVGDPTRYGVLMDEWGEYAGLDSDATHLNSLSAQFDLVFQPDYLYNTAEYEGNYRNIRLTEMASQPLTDGLEQVVFYAAHSLISGQPALIAAGGDTRSSSSERAGDLPVTVLAADGEVLALGDLTFMTEPYNVVYDNDRLVSNIADFLSGAVRRYDLADFPFFFRDEADLVYVGDPVLDSDLLKGGSSLQALFAGQGKTLTVRQAEDKARDTLFFGLYRAADEVEPYLAAAGVTLAVTPTATTEDSPAAIAETSEVTITAGVSATADVETPDQIATSEVTATAQVSMTADLEVMGPVVLSGTAMLILHSEGDRHVLVVLASTEAGLDNAVKRLSDGDVAGCVVQKGNGTSALPIVALCPTGEVAPGKGAGGWPGAGSSVTPPPVPNATPTPTSSITTTTTPTPTATPVAGPKQKIIVVALDDTKGRYDSKTSVDDYYAILKDKYDVTVWSEAKDGAPPTADLVDYDLVVWTSGDFETPFGQEESAALGTMMLAGVPVIVSGAFLSEDADVAVQQDVQVEDASHPVVKGFAKGEVIAFVPAPSGQDYAVQVLGEEDAEDSTVVMVRGPASKSPGLPSVVVLEEGSTGFKILYVAFPLYLMPGEAKTRLVLNAADWMLSE